MVSYFTSASSCAVEQSIGYSVAPINREIVKQSCTYGQSKPLKMHNNLLLLLQLICCNSNKSNEPGMIQRALCILTREGTMLKFAHSFSLLQTHYATDESFFVHNVSIGSTILSIMAPLYK